MQRSILVPLVLTAFLASGCDGGATTGDRRVAPVDLGTGGAATEAVVDASELSHFGSFETRHGTIEMYLDGESGRYTVTSPEGELLAELVDLDHLEEHLPAFAVLVREAEATGTYGMADLGYDGDGVNGLGYE